ncbi:hypothetical protein DRO54_08435 [Candidatus Bathyarchaeota archaeon]|nr:MAG: hypothetical protein DRO54_08435 [Candidatus Bathyarchaeota archaeon]
MSLSEEKELSIEDLIEILGSTIKHDDDNKVITFLVMLLTYTHEDQINLGFLAESSTGKSYIPLEISAYFPQEDVIKIGYASPSSWSHLPSTLMSKYGVPITDEHRPTRAKVKEELEFEGEKPSKEEIEAEYQKRKRLWKEMLKESYYLVDFERKIVIFLDMPHYLFLQRIRPLASHDEREITHIITDKKERHGLRTKKIVIRGFPTIVYCSAKLGMEEQEKTRLLLLSPEKSQEKLRESIFLKIEREADRDAFIKRLMEDPKRKMLMERVRRIKEANIRNVIIPEELRSFIYTQFMEDHPYLIPRHQRDISRLLALIKAHALLNFMNRKQTGNPICRNIIVNEKDVEAGFRLYYSIAEANEFGLSPELWEIYRKLKPYFNENGLTILEFQKAYFKEFHKPIGYKYAKEILQTLESAGLLYHEPDPSDKRKLRYKPLESGVKNSSNGIGELYDILRNELPEPFYENKAIDLIIKVRKCSFEEAERIFQIFVDEGKLFRDPYGLWHWSK